MTYIPSPKQVEAHCAEERFLGYGGAMGGGKTRWLCEMALLMSVKFPGNFGLLARQSGPALKLSTMEVFFTETLPVGGKLWKSLGCKMNKGEGVLEFRHLNPPSRIWFTGLDNDNLERVKSLNLGFFGIDEATETSESIYLMLATRLRRKGIPKVYRKAMITANPEAGWVKRRFVDQSLKDHKFIQANYMDNPYLPDDYPSIFDTMSLNWRQKYLEGNWGAVSGLIWREFEPGQHIIRGFDIPPEWRKLRGLDHGQQNPACCLGMVYGYPDDHELKWMIGPERMELMNPQFSSYPIFFIPKMYYSTGLVSDHRKGIFRTFPPQEEWGPIYADPSIWRKDREKLISDGKSVPYSIAHEYGDPPYALRGLTRANNIVNVGINRVAQLLRIGHLYFFDDPSLEDLIGDAGEIRSYSWKQPRTDDDDWPEEPLKQRDHACDALRYGAMSGPPLKSEDKKIIPYNSFLAARKRAIEFKKRKSLTIRNGRLVGF